MAFLFLPFTTPSPHHENPHHPPASIGSDSCHIQEEAGEDGFKEADWTLMTVLGNSLVKAITKLSAFRSPQPLTALAFAAKQAGLSRDELREKLGVEVSRKTWDRASTVKVHLTPAASRKKTGNGRKGFRKLKRELGQGSLRQQRTSQQNCQEGGS